MMMNAPQLILKTALPNKGYRLRCRFKIEPYPSVRRLDQEKVRVAERFVHDMHGQGWENDGRFGFKMTGPFPRVQPITIHPQRRLSAKEMLSGVLQGARFRDNGGALAWEMPKLVTSEWWEFELAGVFVRQQILTERPDPGEE